MERESFAGALQRRWWVVVVAALIGGVLGALPSPQRAVDSVSSFQATHTLVLDSNDPSGIIRSDTLSVNQIVLLAKAGDVPRLVAERIGFTGNPAQLASQVTVTLDPASNAVQITTNQPTADYAVLIADTFADVLGEYLVVRQDRIREDRLAAALTRLDDLEVQISELGGQATANPDDQLIQAKLNAVQRRYSVVFEQYDTLSEAPTVITLATLESAQPIGVQSQGLQAPGSRRSRGMFGFLAGAAVGLAAVWAMNLLDRRIRQRSQAEAIFGVPVQLTVPVAHRKHHRGVVVRRSSHDHVSDAYRAMRSVLALAQSDRVDRTKAPITLVLSSGPADGKTTATANIAAAFAESGASTVAVNADFRRPSLAAALEVAPAPGGDDAADALRASTVVRGLKVHDWRLVDKGSTPGDLARRTVRFLPNLTRTFDQVVIDTPPVSLAAEVLELLPHADTIIVMVRVGHTRLDAAAKTAETLRALGISDFVLVVIGGATDRSYGYGYGYGYGRYNERSTRRTRSEARANPQPIDVA